MVCKANIFGIVSYTFLSACGNFETRTVEWSETDHPPGQSSEAFDANDEYEDDRGVDGVQMRFQMPAEYVIAKQFRDDFEGEQLNTSFLSLHVVFACDGRPFNDRNWQEDFVGRKYRSIVEVELLVKTEEPRDCIPGDECPGELEHYRTLDFVTIPFTCAASLRVKLTNLKGGQPYRTKVILTSLSDITTHDGITEEFDPADTEIVDLILQAH